MGDSVIWFAVKDENAGMLADDVYDAFALVPLYLGMYYKQDLYIHGLMSKRLCKNIMNYLQRILCDFSDDLSRIDVKVDGFGEVGGEQNLIGTGISCGVDSLSTIYDRYINESDPEYKINALFLFNCGTLGEYGEEANRRYFAQFEMNKAAADELGLTVYQVNSNLHAFTRRMGRNAKAGYIAIWSCIFSLAKAVKKYYVSSCFSYAQILDFGRKFHDYDFAEFSESYSVPLFRTEKLELVIDGCQYERCQKIERISGWDIARKYLNVCNIEVHNCSECDKCLTTMIELEALGRLDDFAGLFDMKKYRRHYFYKKALTVYNHFRGEAAGNEADPYDFLKSHGINLPSYFTARIYMLSLRASSLIKQAVRKIMGDKFYEAIKRTLKHPHSS